MTWVSQFCCVVGLDDVDGLLASCDFIGLIMCVFAKDLILYMATEGRFQRIHWIPEKEKQKKKTWNSQVNGVNWKGDARNGN